MNFGIQIEYFKDSEGRLAPKKIGVVAVERRYIGHWIVSSPCDFNELPSAIRSENNTITRYQHGLEWFDGGITYKQVHHTMVRDDPNPKRTSSATDDKRIRYYSRDILRKNGKPCEL
ncbi:uncharacterized protein LOC112493994 [Cephus cinctus]|uniref:Uncharacterized protein LOC112493994 n=1 Tax=Cephus cinctus TaxID=211228 RepID=A0AAJ7RCZ5_CEPCN|nr:uncharacterized protein LOC112493994 [Cephus cinctus]